MAAITICSDFGAPQNKVWHCFPIYFPWNDGTKWLLKADSCWDIAETNIVLQSNYPPVQNKVKVLIAQSCLTLCNLIKCSWPGSSVHGNLQARILEWVAIFISRGSSWPRDWIRVSCIAGRFFTVWATREVDNKLTNQPKQRNNRNFFLSEYLFFISGSVGQWIMDVNKQDSLMHLYALLPYIYICI